MPSAPPDFPAGILEIALRRSSTSVKRARIVAKSSASCSAPKRPFTRDRSVLAASGALTSSSISRPISSRRSSNHLAVSALRILVVASALLAASSSASTDAGTSHLCWSRSLPTAAATWGAFPLFSDSTMPWSFGRVPSTRARTSASDATETRFSPTAPAVGLNKMPCMKVGSQYWELLSSCCRSLMTSKRLDPRASNTLMPSGFSFCKASITPSPLFSVAASMTSLSLRSWRRPAVGLASCHFPAK